ncbi:MAG: murein biosynthesis integral membrane protein MurJ [Candidatus Moranbacteria bacterium]|nr:murein biosynthesis integral membrane protein MurJ [Candidatus Moranbacteria bacterium]
MIKTSIKALRLFMQSTPTQSVGVAAVIIATAGMASRLLGLVRDRILATQFGAGNEIDIYAAAFRLPDLMFDLLVLGALSAAFIPVFTCLRESGKMEEAWKMTSGVLTVLVTVLAGVGVLLWFFAPTILPLFVPGFDESKIAQTVSLTRVMLLGPIFLSVSAVFGGVLVSVKKFTLYALAPVLYNTGIIIGAVWFVDEMGIIGLAWGVVFGAILHILIQTPAVASVGFRYIPQKVHSIFSDIHLRRVIRLMLPRMFGTASNQISWIVITFFASTLATGSLAVFTFANNIQSVPLGLIGIPFAVAVFPTLATLMAHKKNQEFERVVIKEFRRILFLVLPISVLLILLRAQVVRVILGAGAFDWEDTILTFTVLGILAVSLFAQSTIPLLARSFYAMEDTKTPFFIALFAQFINIILVIVLVDRWQIVGIAIAFSVATTVNMTGLLLFLHRRLKVRAQWSRIGLAIGKIIVATAGAACATQIGKIITGTHVELDTFLAVFYQLLFAGLLGVGTYIILSYLLHIDEFFSLRKEVLKRVFRRSAQASEEISETH